MIGKILPHKPHFAGRAAYALYEPGLHTERASWTIARNLEGVEPDLAHVVMAATAKQSRRVKVPCGHLIVSWAQADQPDDGTMIDILDQTMADLGLAEHQALYVAHDDTDHRHVHVIFNRVHPETYKTARDSHERLKLRRSLTRQEQEHGLTQTPMQSRGRHQRPVLSEIEIAAREDRDPLLRMSKRRCDQLREDLAYCFSTARGWGSFHGMLRRRGYELAKAGPGVRIIKHGRFAKLSDILPPKLNTKTLKNRWGEFDIYWKSLAPQKQKQRQRNKQKRRQKQNTLVDGG